MLKPISKKNTLFGYMLIEVLVTVGILAVGLLGVAAMQITALQSGYSSVQRGEAAILIADITDRMRINTAGVYAGNYSDLEIGTPVASTSVMNSALDRAQQDFNIWNQQIIDTFGTNAAATGDITCTATPPSPAFTNCIIEIVWQDLHGETSLQNGGGTYTHLTSVVF